MTQDRGQDVELQPTTDEVIQQEADDDYGTTQVPVCVEEVKTPVRAQLLPRKSGATRTRVVDGTRSLPILTADPRRASAILISADAPFRVALSEATSQDEPTMAQWPANVPLTLTCTTDVYVKAAGATPDVTCELSVITENWADGR